jgi:hypothetical protein
MVWFLGSAGLLGAQEAAESSDGPGGFAGRPKTGYLIEVPVPIGRDASEQLLGRLKQLADSTTDTRRITVVLRYRSNDPVGDGTPFEDALRLARVMTQPDLRRLRIVAWVDGPISGHSVLPILASDTLLVGRSGSVENASAGEASVDETIAISYQSIAKRRGLFPPAIVTALVDPAAELARVSKVGGEEVFATGPALQSLRASGEVLSEDLWSTASDPLRLDAQRLRQARIAAGVVQSTDDVSDQLDLAELKQTSETLADQQASGVLLELVGSIAGNRVRRWQSNLNATLESGDINTWLVAIDSVGGDLAESVLLASWFSQPEPPLQRVAGFVRGEARGDAALVAVACRPLLINPEATIGGFGGDAIAGADVRRQREAIEQVARAAKRPDALIRGLLDPQLVVYRYTNRKTGRIRYATREDLLAGAEDPDAELAQWQRGEQIDLSGGISAARAVELGLADGLASSIDEAATRIGLQDVPPVVEDRKVVRFVERLGRSQSLAFLLLFIGFIALSAEANAPGLSFPGFISMVCFALYFWMKFLAGTAEWLELVLFALGLACIAIEVFLVPGLGIFGVGGLVMMVLGVVLMSQTFVIPQNTYQLDQLTRGVWLALGGVFGMIGGFILMRAMFPHVPLLRGLVMEAPDSAVVHEAEKLADYGHLLSQSGVTTTPLRPSGKAKFGDQIIQVVSDGAAVAAGQGVRIVEVHGTRVVVEPAEE